ncbi:MAG TPA: hypothetical protein VJN88_09865 [Ktedonobacterales bacterium]|nr:hypothetical protein [Ktedonobacterales bacterium]
MTAYKLFSSQTVGDDLSLFEQMISEWLRAEEPRIAGFAQSVLGTHVIVSIIYEAASEGGAEIAESVEVPEVFERTMERANLDPSIEAGVLLPEAELPY